jgi:hypothetical protein
VGKRKQGFLNPCFLYMHLKPEIAGFLEGVEIVDPDSFLGKGVKPVIYV